MIIKTKQPNPWFSNIPLPHLWNATQGVSLNLSQLDKFMSIYI